MPDTRVSRIKNREMRFEIWQGVFRQQQNQDWTEESGGQDGKGLAPGLGNRRSADFAGETKTT